VAIGGITMEEHAAQQIELNAELVGQMPKGAMDRPIRIELTDQDRADLAAPAISGTPLVVGVVKTISPAVGALDRLGFKGGVTQETDGGGFVWAVTVTSPGAQGIRVHFEKFSLPPGAEMYFFGLNGQAHGPYIGEGRDGNGDFWTRSIASDTGVIQLRFAEADREKISFVISELGHIAGRGSSQVEKDDDYWPCWDNVECLIDAMCPAGSGTPADPAKDAVAKMEWVIGQYIYTCTGGLLVDTDPGTQIPYMLTANHCFDASISNLETFFFYTTDSCEGLCPGLWYNPPAPPPSTIGITVQATGETGDFTLATLDEDPPGGVTFLGWNNTAIAYSEGAALYRISNANFGPQVYSDYTVNTTTGTCTGIPRGAWIYSNYENGATMGGSSGSPVLNSDSEVVGQLTGCCGYNCGDDCDFENNWTIDGAMAYYWDSVKDFLNPGVECTENWECDDDDPCTTDECIDFVCYNTPFTPCCGDGYCEGLPDEDCNNCPADCISGTGDPVCGNGLCEGGDGEDCRNCSADCNGKTTGAPSGRFCCGATEGCDDPRCNETGWACTMEPQGTPYCCGDGACEGAEDINNCPVDCGCTVPADCDDSNECTVDDCVGGVCENTPVADDTPCSGGICCGGTCEAAVCSGGGDCDDAEACTTDICYNGDTCSAYCDNVWPACGLSDGCCGPTCEYPDDPDCEACVPDGGYCTSNEECCSLSCHPAKNYCR
jgi:V8-like Glu-specific endopeptidase